MLLGFKQRFEPMILDGSKQHTIRGDRADGKLPTVGEILHCYVNPRQKSMRLLGRWPCVKVEDIAIYTRIDGTLGVVIGSSGHLDDGEKNALAWADGFRSRGRRSAFAEMREFWIKVHGDKDGFVRFDGHIIYWDFSKPVKRKTRR